MISFFKDLTGPNWAAFLSRALIGILMTMAGYGKVFVFGTSYHTQEFFIKGFEGRWIPEPLLVLLGHGIPYFELIVGVLVLVGLFTRPALVGLGFLHLLTTYGHALQSPLFDIDGFTFTRMVIIVFLLMLPVGTDKLSVDYLRSQRGSA